MMVRLNFSLFFRLSFLLVAVLFIVGCSGAKSSVPPEKYCSTDSDCVAATCCHATDAVGLNYAPTCAAVMCSMDCQEKTLDCGQGEIKCIENTCSVVLSS
ncbi:hypothetical protein HYV86_03895 [Candidatus Woesearchaeota archaeon]|nr:hypothetical protein [Candidatus Woesearchaeota archaeon]